MDGNTHEKDEDSGTAVSSRRSKVMRGVVTPILAVLAVACIVLGVMNATIWKPSSDVSAGAQLNSRYITTDPGVLNLVDDKVDVTLKASNADATVCMALGYAQDVSGWLAGHSYQRITGLQDWTVLEKQRSTAATSTDAEDAVAFQDSDMWTSVKCATASVSMQVNNSNDRIVLLVDTDANAADDTQSSGTQQLTMSWVRTELPDFAMPLYFAGGLLAVLAVMTASVFAMEPERRRKRIDENAEEVQEPEITVMQAVTGTLSPIGRSIRSAVKPKPKNRRHSRHSGGEHDAEEAIETVETTEAETLGTPKIIDTGARNMLAAQQRTHEHKALSVEEPEEVEEVEHQGSSRRRERSEHSERRSDRAGRTRSQRATHTEETAVISTDDLASYFARLSSEDTPADEKNDAGDDNARKQEQAGEAD